MISHARSQRPVARLQADDVQYDLAAVEGGGTVSRELERIAGLNATPEFAAIHIACACSWWWFLVPRTTSVAALRQIGLGRVKGH